MHNITVTSLPERDVAGDVHALAFVAKNAHHQQRLQAALKRIVDKVEISRTPPDPAWAVHSSSVVAHTLLRQTSLTAEQVTSLECVWCDPSQDQVHWSLTFA